MKLISLLQFILDQGDTSTFDTDQGDWMHKEISKLDKIRNYANFLSQTLTLGMFVPYDLEGDVLNEPKKEDYTEEELSNIEMGVDYVNWQEARELVLFEDLTAMNVGDCCIVLNVDTQVWISWDNLKTISDLINFNLTLTEAAKKQLGL